MKTWTYEKAGVSRKRGDQLVSSIQKMNRGNQASKVHPSIGGYASVIRSGAQYVAATTDGVGTKLKLAFESGIHSTIGIDLVAMSVNDLLCVGSKPAFFLDYFATGGLKLSTAKKVLSGIVKGCEMAECALVGGETAEMPGIYQKGEYDLAGFAVGFLSSKQLLPKKALPSGLALVGVASSGFHSNGYSLLRKLLPQSGKNRKDLVKALLSPTEIYVRSLWPVIEKGWVQGMAHITGSGFLNLPRISDKLDYDLVLPPLEEIAPCYTWLRHTGKIKFEEAAQTFNMGLGMVLAVKPKDVGPVIGAIHRSGKMAWLIGETRKKSGRVPKIDLESRDWGNTRLHYL